MKKNSSNIKAIKYLILIFMGFSFGIVLVWPNITSTKGRNCFFNIIKDGSDGSIKLSTVLSIQPNYLLKIKNARNTYYKILYIGDYCFRK